MSENNSNTGGETFTLKVAGVVLPTEEKDKIEKAAGDMAAKLESIDHLDPLDAEPAVVFSPTP